MKMVKIQIQLPNNLRKEIDKMRVFTGESVSGFMRAALQERVNKSKEMDFPMKDNKVEPISKPSA